VKTQLKNRVLWYDGTSQVDPDLVPQLLLAGVPPQFIALNGRNEDVDLFNSLADEPLEFGKIKNRPLDVSWKIPAKYQSFDLDKELHELLIDFVTVNSRLTSEQRNAYKNRLMDEIKEVKIRGMEMMLRTLWYVLDTLREKNIVWGVGRGSSCASLILFLMGLHKVDPIKYNIPLTEFFHD
jgi:DNA polymerase III alpha subunit